MDHTIKIPCISVPVRGHTLLLPNSAISEVIIIKEQIQQFKDMPRWSVGYINWQNEKVFILSFDQIDHESNYSTKNKHLCLIIKNPDLTSALRHIALIAEDTPQIVQANSQSIDRNLHPQSLHSCALSYATINSNAVILPDISKLASLINQSCTSSEIV